MQYYRPLTGMSLLLVGVAACVICFDGAHGFALSPVAAASFQPRSHELTEWDAGRRLAQAPETETPEDLPADDAGTGGGTVDQVEEPTDAVDPGGTTDPVDPDTGGGTTDPVDTDTGGGTTDPVDTDTGGGTTDPVDPDTGGGTTNPVTPGTGGGTTDPVDPGTGGGTTDPVDPGTGGGTTDPVDPGTGGGTTDPVDTDTGGGTTDPVDPDTGGGTTNPVTPGTGGGTTNPVDPGTGGGTTNPVDPGTGGGTTDPVVPPTDPGTDGGTIDPVVPATDPGIGGGTTFDPEVPTDPNAGGVDTDPGPAEETPGGGGTDDQTPGEQMPDGSTPGGSTEQPSASKDNTDLYIGIGAAAAVVLLLVLVGLICARCFCSRSKQPQQYQQQPYPAGYTEQYPLQQQQWQGNMPPMAYSHDGTKMPYQHPGSPYSSQGNMPSMVYSHDGTKMSYSHDGYQPGYTNAHLSNGEFSSVHSGVPGSMASGTQGIPPGAYASSMGGSLVNTRVSNTMSSASGNTEVNQLRHTMVTAVNTMNASDVRGMLENALDNFAQTQKPFLDRYIMLSAAHRRQGGQGVVQFARGVHDGEEYAIKFFTHRPAFLVEFELYQNPVLRSMMPAVTHIETNENGQIVSGSGWPMPPCIVIERGESLDKWALRIKPDFTTILQVLTHVCTRLQLLHDSGLAHRDLKPGNILWRPKHLQWTLIDFGCAAEIGKPAPVSLSLKYAAPEVVRAFEAQEQTIVVEAAMDMWALGIMAFELLTEEPVFPPYTGASDVCDQVAGRKPLPWEAPDADEKLKKLRMLRRSLVKCLSRIPSERPTSKELLASWNRLFDVVGDRTMAG